MHSRLVREISRKGAEQKQIQDELLPSAPLRKFIWVSIAANGFI
jgi:hypothetical protein